MCLLDAFAATLGGRAQSLNMGCGTGALKRRAPSANLSLIAS